MLLREDELPVGEDVELALRPLLDVGLVVRLRVQLGRETRGPGVVAVSDGAVLDQNLGHGSQSYLVDSPSPRAHHRAR
jgi:hypothetical protein